MRIFIFLLSILLPSYLYAQYTYPIQGPVPEGALLLKLGTETILIHPIDDKNQSHKWITFDSTLTITSTKKLVTPGGENIISQNYLQGAGSIIRIDQFLFDGELIVSAFVFDVKGNLIRKKEIENIFVTGKKFVPLPFYIAQSPDKKVVSLIQPSIVAAENLSALCIVFDELLNVTKPRYFTVPFRPKLFDLYMPLVNNDKTVFIPTAEKFNSYRLSSVVNGYVLRLDENISKEIQFNFERKKIKELNFKFLDDKIFFSGLYSLEKDKDEVAGLFSSGYDVQKNLNLKTEEYIFSDKVKAALKKTYGTERRKGNLLNYLSMLPTSVAGDRKYSYAILLPERKNNIIVPSAPSASQPDELRQIKQQAEIANSYIGTQPPGYSRPMSAAEAAVYAAGYSKQPALTNYEGWKPKQSKASQSRERLYDKNLLFFDFKDADTISGHRFLKIKSAPDSAYKFFAYVPAADGLGALHYAMPDFGTPYLKSSIINANGKLVEKKVFEDKNRILSSDYPFVMDAETVVTFYEDKITGQMGLIRLKL